MNDCLQSVRLDRKFSLYKIIAFTKDDGLLQFVPKSMTITDILNEYKGKNQIFNFLND